MKLFEKKPEDYEWTDHDDRGSLLDERMKTILVAAIVGAVVIIAMAISVKFLKEGKNPFGETAASGKTEKTEAAREDDEDRTDPGGESAPSDTETGNTVADEAPEEEPQKKEPQKKEPAQETPEETPEESTQGTFTFEDACMVCVDRSITDSDIDAIYSTAPSDLPETPIQMAINYIYAWYGYHFKTDDIREYFLKLDWYTDRGKSIDTVNAEMNAMHKENVKKLVKLR